MLYHLYGAAHRMAKKLLHRTTTASDAIGFFYLYSDRTLPVEIKGTQNLLFVNDGEYRENVQIIDTIDLFCGENALVGAITPTSENVTCSKRAENPSRAWRLMLEQSEVKGNWRNSGFHLTGYIKEKQQWTLSSWIWTSAAICRCYITMGELEKARTIADAFLREQLEDGGWIVRYDFSKEETIPMVAPNDSAYIADNALLKVYCATKEKKYLAAAIRCADWIIATAREDGLVLVGMNERTGHWYTHANIVDIGFTGGLFANLFELTQEEKYKNFLQRFIKRYIDLFWDAHEGAFHTSLNAQDLPGGGYFARGQAWAMEGLIPAWEVTKDPQIKDILNQLSKYLLKHQQKDGGWAYNFAKPLMGQDCKGIPIIAKNMLYWGTRKGEKEQLTDSAKKALEWCRKHTVLSGECVGGIFSYSVEGAVVHDLYTETAFTYSSAYALELELMLSEDKEIKDVAAEFDA